MWKTIRGHRVWITEQKAEDTLYNVKNLRGNYKDSRIGVFKVDVTTRRLSPCLECGKHTSSQKQVCQRCQEKRNER